MKLRISDSLALPLDFATKTAAILAQRRKGKTYAASVIAEELVAAKQPFVALDPTGAWWGLRAAAQHPDAPGSAEDLQARVLERIDGPMRRCLEPLLAVYPNSMSRERLAAEAGYQPGTGAFQNALGRLRTVGAIDYPDRGHAQALPWLFLEDSR